MTLMDAYLGVAASLSGLVFGSFLNVVIYRLPRHESLAWPGSHCPRCGHPIRARDNVPILGWIALRGRCRDCKNPISGRYPLVEGLTSLLFLAAFVHFGVSGRLPLALAFCCALVAITFIDIDHQIIPDRIVLPGALIGLAASVLLRPGGWWEYLAAGLGASALLFLLAMLWSGGMGFGDVKMALLMGFVLGRGVVVAMFLAFFLGGVVGAVLLATHVKSRKDRIPFGPYLAAASAVALFFGADIINAYVRLF